MAEARANPSKNGQFRSGTLAEIQATALLEGQPGWATDAKAFFVGSQASGNQQVGGSVWANNDLAVRWDPSGNGGAGTGDGLSVTSTGLVRHKPAATDAPLDHQTQGRGYLRIRGTTDAVPATPPGNNSVDLQIKRAGAVGVQQADSFAHGEDINVLAVGCIANGGVITCDCAPGSSRAVYQYQASGGWNLTTYAIRGSNHGYGNTVGGSDIGAAGLNCTAGAIVSGSGPGFAGGYRTCVYGSNASAFGFGGGAYGVPASTASRRTAVTIATNAGVTTVVVAGDLTSIYFVGGAPVVLWALNGSINNTGTNGWVWRSAVTAASYNSGANQTTITIADAIPNGVTAGFLCSLNSAVNTGNSFSGGHNCHALARRAAAYGIGGVAAVDNTVNIGGALCSRMDYGDVTNGDEIVALPGVEVVLYSKLVDLTVVAQAPAVSIPTNSRFFPRTCGLQVRGEWSGVTVQPTVKLGISGNTAKHRAAAITTQLTSTHRKDEAAVATNDGETSLQGEVTVGATGTTMKGYFYWVGELVQTG